MILSFRDKRTERFAAGKPVKAFSGISDAARRRLAILHAAETLGVLAALPGNRLEALKGDSQGRYSIRMNDQWRICFVWSDEKQGAEEVEIVDYH